MPATYSTETIAHIYIYTHTEKQVRTTQMKYNVNIWGNQGERH